MPAIAHKILAGVLFVLAGHVAVAAPTQWPTSPSRTQLPTPYGNLHVANNEYVYESRLQIDDADIDPMVQGILNITYAFSTPNSHTALVSINTGNNACPYTYRWVVLEKSGYRVSPEFGSCNDQIKVTVKGRKLTMLTPSAHTPNKVDMYVYDGKTLKHRSAQSVADKGR
ncbi:hypothetical protein CR159_19305 [Pollutimonas subterranea]|uniref:Uncharacterized protein n=1 Tax=Pollutimonas subterranea TaxID=2045210 RepID=A0A2N4TZM8_9BURK|nr:hypothetical protein [Pollutimonas subterranea]PLC48222.1 hypothetical protein CR159_19305 [Pollutimonas subterranea]